MTHRRAHSRRGGWRSRTGCDPQLWDRSRRDREPSSRRRRQPDSRLIRARRPLHLRRPRSRPRDLPLPAATQAVMAGWEEMDDSAGSVLLSHASSCAVPCAVQSSDDCCHVRGLTTGYCKFVSAVHRLFFLFFFIS